MITGQRPSTKIYNYLDPQEVKIMAVSLDKHVKGHVVKSPKGTGVITDMGMGDALVRLYSGDLLDETHGRWFPVASLVVVGYDPNELVWSGSRMRTAAEYNMIHNTKGV